MAEKPETTDREAPTKGNVPSKRLPWLWTILLLMVLPAVGAGLWFGGTRHRVDDRPGKQKPSPKRLVPKKRMPMTTAMAPAIAPAMTPAIAPAMARPAVRPVAPPMAAPPKGAMQ